MIGNKFNVRAYCQQSLVDALYHLLSIKFALISPALKITARSLFAQPEPSSHERLIYFFTIGIPLSILVGILAGIFHFLKAVSNNVIIHGGLSFYTRQLIYKKLGIFSFLGKPIMNLIHFFDQFVRVMTVNQYHHHLIIQINMIKTQTLILLLFSMRIFFVILKMKISAKEYRFKFVTMIIREYLYLIGYISALFVICCIIYFIIRYCCKTNKNSTMNNRVYIQQHPQSVFNSAPPSYRYISQQQMDTGQPSAPISTTGPTLY